MPLPRHQILQHRQPLFQLRPRRRLPLEAGQQVAGIDDRLTGVPIAVDQRRDGEQVYRRHRHGEQGKRRQPSDPVGEGHVPPSGSTAMPADRLNRSNPIRPSRVTGASNRTSANISDASRMGIRAEAAPE